MSEENQTNLFSNAKLSTIFLIVLGLHIVVIVLISAYHLLKGGSDTEITETITAPEQVTYDTVFSTESASGFSAPETDDGPGPGGDSSMEPMSMPSADDPIWTGQSAVEATDSFSRGYDSELPEPVFETGPQAAPQVAMRAPVTPSPAKTESPVENKQPVVSNGIHVVQRGDTLSGIAAKYGIGVTRLQQDNGLTSTLIRIGQKLRVPGEGNETASAPRAAAVRATYQVSPGDTLWRIARKYDTTPQELAEINGITDPSKLKVGDVLQLPSSSAASSEGLSTTTDMAMRPGT